MADPSSANVVRQDLAHIRCIMHYRGTGDRGEGEERTGEEKRRERGEASRVRAAAPFRKFV